MFILGDTERGISVIFLFFTPRRAMFVIYNLMLDISNIKYLSFSVRKSIERKKKEKIKIKSVYLRFLAATAITTAVNGAVRRVPTFNAPPIPFNTIKSMNNTRVNEKCFFDNL